MRCVHKVFLNPCRHILYTIMSVFNAELSDGSKVMAVCVGRQPCPLCAEISQDSLNVLMISCSCIMIVDGEIPKVLTTVPWETLSLKCWTFPTQFFYYTCLWTSQPFEDAAFISSHDTITLHRCFWAFHNFPSLLLPLSRLFWGVLRASGSEWVYTVFYKER